MMKYLLQFALIGLISLVAELMGYFIPIPVPASIYGLVLLFLLLCFKVIKLEWVEDVAGFMLVVIPIMFVPPVVSLITKWDAIKYDVVTIVMTVVASTLITVVFSGLITNFMVKRRRKA